MVPAALKGLDVRQLLDHAEVAVKQCKPDEPIKANPGAVLGAAIGTLAKRVATR